MIEEAIFSRLSGWAGFSALVTAKGAKVYPMRAPQNVAPPYLVYQRIGGPRLRSMDGPTGAANPRIQIDAYAATYLAAKMLSKQVRLSLDGFTGTITTGDGTGVTIRSCSLESDRDLIDPDVDPLLYRVSHDFLIWHDE